MGVTSEILVAGGAFGPLARQIMDAFISGASEALGERAVQEAEDLAVFAVERTVDEIGSRTRGFIDRSLTATEPPNLPPVEVSKASNKELVDSLVIDRASNMQPDTGIVGSFLESGVAGVAGPILAATMGWTESNKIAMQTMQELNKRASGEDSSAEEINSLFGEKTQATSAEKEGVLRSPLTEEEKAGLDQISQNLGLPDGFFTSVRPTRSSDGSRVSMEKHEYDYNLTPIVTLSLPGGGTGSTQSYIGAALELVRNILTLGDGEVDGGITLDSLTNALDQADNLNLQDIDFDPANFSYGNYVDSRNFRKLIGSVRKVVRLVRSANVKEVLRLTTQQAQNEFAWEILYKLRTRDLYLAAIDVVAITSDLTTAQEFLIFDQANVIKDGVPTRLRTINFNDDIAGLTAN